MNIVEDFIGFLVIFLVGDNIVDKVIFVFGFVIGWYSYKKWNFSYLDSWIFFYWDIGDLIK